MAKKHGPEYWARRYELRDASARSKGYKSYYDYRKHGYGKQRPGTAKPGTEELAQIRGHRSIADLEKSLGNGDRIAINEFGPRGKDGRYTWVEVILIDSKGRDRRFVLRGQALKRARLERFLTRVENSGAVMVPNPSFDLSHMYADEDLDEGDYGEDEDE